MKTTLTINEIIDKLNADEDFNWKVIGPFNENSIEFEAWSNAGEDIVVDVEFKTVEDFITELKSYAKNFDANEHITTLLGLPWDMNIMEIYNDWASDEDEDLDFEEYLEYRTGHDLRHAINGCPDVGTLIEDTKDIRKMYQNLASDVEKILKA